MARAKDIAALAGLAGLAYAMRNKGDSKSGETTSSKKDADDNDTLARANREESSGLSKTKNSVVSAITAPKSASNDKAGNQGVLSQESVTPKAPPKAAAKLETITTRKDPREAEAGMSRGTRTPAKPVSTASSSEEGMKNYKPRRTPAASTSSSSEEGMKNYKPRNTPANPNYSNEGRSSTAPTIASKVGNAVKTAAKTAYSGVPTSEQAAANRQAAYDKVKSVGSSAVDYVKNFETPAERRSREAKEASGMKRGGMTKMASGGMTASRRADGIATKGKTRGKIC